MPWRKRRPVYSTAWSTPIGWSRWSRPTTASMTNSGRPWPRPTCLVWPCLKVWAAADLGLTELCLVLEAQGRVVAPVPLWATVVLGAFRWPGSELSRMRQAWLPEVAAGHRRCSSAAVTGSSQSVTRTTPRRGRQQTARLRVARCRIRRAVWSRGRPHHRAGPHRRWRSAAWPWSTPPRPASRSERAETTNREICTHLHLDGVRIEADDVVAHPGPDRTTDRPRSSSCSKPP